MEKQMKREIRITMTDEKTGEILDSDSLVICADERYIQVHAYDAPDCIPVWNNTSQIELNIGVDNE